MKNIALTNALLLLLLIVVSAAVTYLMDGLITDEMWVEDASKYFNQDVIEEVIKNRTDFSHMSKLYLFKSVWLIAKVFATTGVILCGFYFSDVKVNAAIIFQSVVLSWFVYLIPLVIKVCWFTFIDVHYSLSDLSSVSNSFPTDWLISNIQEPYSKVIKPFRVFNPLEVIFCFAVSYFLNSSGLTSDNTTKVVLSSNFFMLLVVAVFMSFILSLRL